MRWNELSILSPYLASEAVSVVLQEIAGGFTYRNTGHGVLYRAWLPETEQLEEQVENLLARLASQPAELLEEGLPTVNRGWIDEEDWSEAWKAYWNPMRIGRRLVIKPSWQDWPPADQPDLATPEDIIIELDPGMAFGTGTHATTSLCLATLEDYVQPGMHLVDLGCGSGILTIAALKLGAADVLAIDNDPLAVQATADNCRRNGVEGCNVLLQKGIADSQGQWDMIIANISQKIIKLEASHIASRLKPGGLAICSGFYIGWDEEIQQLLRSLGLQIVRSTELEMWSCVVARRP